VKVRAPSGPARWVDAPKGDVHRRVFEYVQRIERDQFSLFNRFAQLEGLYDPNTPDRDARGAACDPRLTEAGSIVIENMIASNVDTVAAQISASDVRARFMVDDADWSTAKMAERLEWYCEGLGKLLGVNERCQLAFRAAAKKGTGVIKAYDLDGEIKIEHVLVDDIIVDETECMNGRPPKQIHHRQVNVDREELIVRFPKFEEQINKAQRGAWLGGRKWAGYRPLSNGIVTIESWKLPIGRKGKPGYRPGRHTITIDGCDLLDEAWDDTEFPLVTIVWSPRDSSWYGISLAERIVSIQRALNRWNWQIDRHLEQYAVPTTYVDMADSKLSVQTINRIGTVVVTKGGRPTTVMPQAVSPEVYSRRVDLKQSGQQESGVNVMASHGAKPAGIDSGIAMREYKDQTTQRFSLQEKAFDWFVLRVYELILRVCKKLGEAAPEITRKAKFGARKIPWAKVDMQDVRVQIAPASNLARTPAGRYQLATEWAQAGVISLDEWRRLTKLPDLDRVLSAYTQGMESVERDIEAIEEGYAVTPEPFGNLLLMVRLGTVAYLRDRDLENVPEEVLEGLRAYVALAAHLLSTTSAANADAAPGAESMPGPQAAPDTTLTGAGVTPMQMAG
jgi:hypothetical protein